MEWVIKQISMKDFYVAQVRVIIDRNESVIIPISGQGYNPNVVKESAENKVRQLYKNKKITSIIISKVDMHLEDYKKATGGNPPWLGGE